MQAAKIVFLGGILVVAFTSVTQARDESSKIESYTPPPFSFHQFTTDVVKRYEKIKQEQVAEKKQDSDQIEKNSQKGFQITNTSLRVQERQS